MAVPYTFWIMFMMMREFGGAFVFGIASHRIATGSGLG